MASLENETENDDVSIEMDRRRRRHDDDDGVVISYSRLNGQ